MTTLGVESAPLVLTSSRKLDVRVGCPSLAEVEYAKSLDLPAWLIPQDALTRDRYRTVKIIVQNPPYNCGCYGRSLCCPSDFNRVPALQECKERNEDRTSCGHSLHGGVSSSISSRRICGSVYVQYSSGYG